MRKSLVIVSLILCAAFINAQDQPVVENPNTPANNQTVIINNSTQPAQPENPNNSTQPAQPENPNNSTVPVVPVVPVNTTQPENPNNSTVPVVPVVPVNTTQPENPNNSTVPVVPVVPVNTTQPENPNNSTVPVVPVVPVNTTQPENPNNSTQPENPNTPNNQTVIVDNSTIPANTTQETNSTTPSGVSADDLSNFRSRTSADDWILTWNVVEEDFNKCKEDQEACCYNVGTITPTVVEQGDKKAIQFTGPATGKNCPQDGSLIITLVGQNSDDDLNPSGDQASGPLLITNNMQGTNTQQTPEQRNLFINDVQANQTQSQNNSTQPQNNSTQPQNNSTAIPEEGAVPVENAPAAQQANQTTTTDFFGIYLPAHPNENTKESSLNVLRLISEESIQTSTGTDTQTPTGTDTQTSTGTDSSSTSTDNSNSSTSESTTQPTSGKVLSACVFAVIALVISI